MVKNKFLFSVLVASSVAPVFASNFIPKECPLNKNQQLAAATLVTDVASTRFLGMKPAFVVRKTAEVKPVVARDENQQEVSVAPKNPHNVNLSRAQSAFETVKNSSVTVGLKTFGVNGEVQVNLLPLVAKAVATAGLLKAIDLAAAKLTAARK